MLCFKESVLWRRNNISFKRDTENVALLQVKERLDTNYCQVLGWKTFVHVSIMHQTSFWETQNIVRENDQLCSFENEKLHFKYTIWFMISEKSITRCTFLHFVARMHQKFQQGIQKNYVPKFTILSTLILTLYELVVFIDMNIQKAGISKHSWKKIMQLLWTVANYLLKKMLNMELNLILIVLVEFANIKHSWNLQQIWWIPCNLSKL